MKTKFITFFIIFFFIYGCQNKKVVQKISPSFKENKNICNYSSKSSSKSIFTEIECTNGYAITIQNEGYDNQSCKIDQYKMKLKKAWHLKYILKCYDFNREYIYDVY